MTAGRRLSLVFCAALTTGPFWNVLHLQGVEPRWVVQPTVLVNMRKRLSRFLFCMK